MILNENRGSYGMFSRAGRSSTEKFHILMKKDEILNGVSKSKLPDIVSHKEDSDQDNNDFDNYADNQNPAFFNDKLIKLNKKQGKQNKKILSRKDQIALEKFEEIISKNKLMNETPNFNKYNPRNEYIWKKIVNNQYWDRSIKKNFSIKQKEEIKAQYYISHDVEGKNVRGLNFIDLARQTKRGNFMNLKTEPNEEGNDQCYNNNKRYFLYDKNLSNSNYNSSNKAKTSTNFYKNKSNLNSQQNSPNRDLYSSSSNGLMNTQEDSNMINYSNNYYNDPKRETAHSFVNKAYRTSTSSFGNFKKDNKKWMKIQAPDFKRMASREKKNLKIDKIRIIPFGFPTFKAVVQKSKNFVHYGKPKTESRKYERAESGPVNADTFDPFKTLSKINNHKEVKGPNFDLMSSRPQSKDPLPCFVQRLYSRQGASTITDKTLKMNHFAEGNFSQSQSSFFPKKSFNKLVNMNLLNSKEFVENHVKNRNEAENDKQGQLNEFITRSMKFYSKNMDDLMKEGMLNKFDNVTYKTIKRYILIKFRENKIAAGDLDKFLVNFEKFDLI